MGIKNNPAEGSYRAHIHTGDHLTLAVMRETALGSGRVLGMLLHSCHMNL